MRCISSAEIRICKYSPILKESESLRGKYENQKIMTHEEISKNTKLSFAAALKLLMKEKPLNKITVKDLTESCGVNRKTFYYHFTDIYDLLKWMLEEEAVNVVKQFDMLTDFQDAALFVLEYVEKNEHLLNCIYDALGRDELKRFFYNDFIKIIENAIDEYEETLGLKVKKLYKRFLCIFYGEAIAGVLIDWLKDPNRVDRETSVSYIDTVLFSSLPAALKAAEKI